MAKKNCSKCEKEIGWLSQNKVDGALYCDDCLKEVKKAKKEAAKGAKKGAAKEEQKGAAKEEQKGEKKAAKEEEKKRPVPEEVGPMFNNLC